MNATALEGGLTGADDGVDAAIRQRIGNRTREAFGVRARALLVREIAQTIDGRLVFAVLVQRDAEECDRKATYSVHEWAEPYPEAGPRNGLYSQGRYDLRLEEAAEDWLRRR